MPLEHFPGWRGEGEREREGEGGSTPEKLRKSRSIKRAWNNERDKSKESFFFK